jgi:hypothetical protein
MLPTERSLVFTDTDQVGGYLIQAQLPDQPPQAVAGFTVNLNPDEGDLTRVSAEELTGQLSGQAQAPTTPETEATRTGGAVGQAPAGQERPGLSGLAIVRSIEELPAVWAEAGRGGTKELTPWLLLGLVLAMVAETWFANRFYDS